MKLVVVLFLFSYSFVFAKESCLTEKPKNAKATYFSCELANGEKSTQINLDPQAPYIVYNGKKLGCTQPMVPDSKIVVMNCMNSLKDQNDWSSFQTIVLDKDEGVLKTRFGSPKMSGLVFQEKCKPQTFSAAGTDTKAEKGEPSINSIR